LQENKGKKENFGTPSPHPSIAARRAAAPLLVLAAAPAAPGRHWPRPRPPAARASRGPALPREREREIWGRAAEHHQARERERIWERKRELV